MFIPWIVLPIIVTVVCLGIMLRPLEPVGGSDHFGIGLFFDMMAGLLRLLWLIPVLVAWVVYLGAIAAGG